MLMMHVPTSRQLQHTAARCVANWTSTAKWYHQARHHQGPDLQSTDAAGGAMLLVQLVRPVALNPRSSFKAAQAHSQEGDTTLSNKLLTHVEEVDVELGAHS